MHVRFDSPVNLFYILTEDVGADLKEEKREDTGGFLEARALMRNGRGPFAG